MVSRFSDRRAAARVTSASSEEAKPLILGSEKKARILPFLLYAALVLLSHALRVEAKAASSSSSSSSSSFWGRSHRRKPFAAVNMLKNGEGVTPPARPCKKEAKAAPVTAAATPAATPTNTSNLIFGDRVLQHGGSGSRRRASTTSTVVPEHEDALPSPLELGDASIEKPQPVLLAEGPDFRFEFISQCELPTDRGLFNLRAYRYTTTKKGIPVVVEPVVLFTGDHQGQHDVLVRVHDQCLTSEVLGSRRCDCKEQLELALDRIVGRDGGLVIYLPQEGRGIGLANKVAAYALQEQGLDTVDANLFLGFGDDERTYDYVRYILKDFGIESIRLATNNPFKTRSLRDSGIAVSNVEPLQAPANRHNLHYLRTKILKMEHAMDLPFGSSSTSSADSLMMDGDAGGATTPEVLTESDKNSTSGSEKECLLEEEQEYEVALGEGDQGQSLVLEEEAEEVPPRYCFGKETVVAAIQAIAEGKMVVVVDDEDRENEGDIIMAADAVTTEAMAFIVRYCSGVVCVSLESEELDRLALPPMIANNEDPKKTAFTVSVDYKYNTTTGISAHDRAMTLRMLASSESVASDFTRPGHIFPLRYAPGGVMTRRGHTEAALDLSRIAGRRPAGVLCEICNDDGSMARLPELQTFVKKHGLVLTSIADLVAYRAETEGRR